MWTASDSSRRVVEVAFHLLDDATALAERDLGISGRWDDPDGDGNYCVVG